MRQKRRDGKNPSSLWMPGIRLGAGSLQDNRSKSCSGENFWFFPHVAIIFRLNSVLQGLGGECFTAGATSHSSGTIKQKKVSHGSIMLRIKRRSPFYKNT